MLTVRQFRVIALSTMLLAVVLAIGSLSMARFALITFSAPSVGEEIKLQVGAFHACVEYEVLGLQSLCGTIDKDCITSFNGPRAQASDAASWYKDGCSKFNVFRGMHVTATLFISISLIVGLIHLLVNPITSPKLWLAMDITFCALAGLAGIFYIVSLITADQIIGGIPNYAGTDNEGNTLSLKVERWTSFGLEGASVAFALVAVIMWIVARFVGKQQTATGPEGLPLNDGSNSPSSYVPPALPGQPQPLFNYGAPPPQPNYQQYGNNPNAPPNTNYGFGWQPPPPQQ